MGGHYVVTSFYNHINHISYFNYRKLIKVLENYIGIWEKASNWIMSYLNNRQFQVYINGTSIEKLQ